MRLLSTLAMRHTGTMKDQSAHESCRQAPRSAEHGAALFCRWLRNNQGFLGRTVISLRQRPWCQSRRRRPAAAPHLSCPMHPRCSVTAGLPEVRRRSSGRSECVRRRTDRLLVDMTRSLVKPGVTCRSSRWPQCRDGHAGWPQTDPSRTFDSAVLSAPGGAVGRGPFFVRAGSHVPAG